MALPHVDVSSSVCDGQAWRAGPTGKLSLSPPPLGRGVLREEGGFGGRKREQHFAAGGTRRKLAFSPAGVEVHTEGPGSPLRALISAGLLLASVSLPLKCLGFALGKSASLMCTAPV